VQLQTKVERVTILLTTLNDPYPTPQGALRPDAGPAASRLVPCETCKRTGRVKERGRLLLCLVCDGGGWRRRRGDEPEWDRYLDMPVAEASTLPVMATPRVEHDDEAFGWERAAISRDRHGSYADLRRQLEWLSGAHPVRYSLVRAVLVDQEPRRLEPTGVLELQLGVVTLALRMPRVRVPHWLMEHREAQERRKTIAALAREGLGAGEIARRLGIPKKVVRRRLRDVKAIHFPQAGVPLRAT
jgi:hypothetical protein